MPWAIIILTHSQNYEFVINAAIMDKCLFNIYKDRQLSDRTLNMQNISPIDLKKQFLPTITPSHATHLKSIINNSTNTQKFHSIIFKDVNSPKNRNNIPNNNNVNQMMEDNQGKKAKHQEKDGKTVVKALMKNGKQNIKQTPINQEVPSCSLINKDQNYPNSNNTHGHIYVYARSTGSPQPFQLKHKKNGSELAQPNKKIKQQSVPQSRQNAIMKSNNKQSQKLPSKQMESHSNINRKQKAKYQKQLKSQFYPPNHSNAKEHQNQAQKINNITKSNSGNKQKSIIRNNDNCLHNYRSANKIYTRHSNSPTINAQNNLYKINTKLGNTNAANTNTIDQNISPPKYSQNLPLTPILSQDGSYKIVSRFLTGSQLKEAVGLEHTINLKSKTQFIKKQLSNKDNNTSNQYTIDPSKTSNKQNGNIIAFAVNSHQGLLRKYNEDRVSIVLNVNKDGVKVSYFAIYDGHGGSSCCDFLTQNLHHYIFNSKKFPTNPKKAIFQGIKLAQTKFLQKVKVNYQQTKLLDRSGSCILIALFVDNDCFVVNLGDSRAVLSTCQGKPIYSLSRDHKPTDTGEQDRIFKVGGKIYRTQMMKVKKNTKMDTEKGSNEGFEIKKNKECNSIHEKNDNSHNQRSNNINENNEEQLIKNIDKYSKTELSDEIIIGPLRVFPGKLSVSRTIGDIEAKQPQFGGIKNCIGTEPQICKYNLMGKQDFIILGCDGIFQKLDSEDVVNEAWKTIKKNKNGTIHEAAGATTQQIIKLCMERKSSDNLTAILICLGSLGVGKNPTGQSSI